PPPFTPFPYTTLFRSAHLGNRQRELLAAPAELEGGSRSLLEPRGDVDPTRQLMGLLADEQTSQSCHQTGADRHADQQRDREGAQDRKSTRLNSSHVAI